ncbi:MAG: hypothetical protein ABSC05_08615 [Candidatus Solibacter sp.]
MKKSKGMIMRLIFAGIALLCATLGFADTITLKSGRVINGTYLGGTARTVRIDDGVNVQTFDVADIRRIEFSGGADDSSPRTSGGSSGGSSNRPTLRRAPTSSSSGSSSDSSDVPTLRRAPSTASSSSDADNDPDRPILHRNPENVMRPDDSSSSPIPTAAPTTGTIPAGTNLTIRMIESVDSETNRVGQTFRASLDQPVTVDGQTAIPRGADVIVKLVDAKESGKLTGTTNLRLSLQSVLINGHFVEINTTSINKESGSQGEKTAKVAGGTAAVGAVIGAIAGGGKGAAIGAGAGAAAGAGSQVITGGERVRIPSETRLTFVLDNAAHF